VAGQFIQSLANILLSDRLFSYSHRITVPFDEAGSRYSGFFRDQLDQDNPVTLQIGLIIRVWLQNVPAIKAGAIISS